MATFNWQLTFHFLANRVTPSELLRWMFEPKGQVVFLLFFFLTRLVPQNSMRFLTHFAIGAVLGVGHLLTLRLLLREDLSFLLAAIKKRS